MSFIAEPSVFLSKASSPAKKSRWLTRSWENIAAIVLATGALISGIATYTALTEAPPLGNDPDTIIWLLNADLVFLLMFVALIARRIVSLWSGRKRGLAGSHLHVRLVYTFSILAAAPAIIMTIFSAFFFHFGVQTWFSERVQTAIDESQAVAEAYLEEHKQTIRADTLAMANDLDRQAMLLSLNEEALDKVVQTQSMFRNLSEVLVFDSSGRVLARSGLTFTLEYEEVPEDALQQAYDGEVVIMTGGANDDRVRALVKLGNFVDTFLFVGRMIDPQVLGHVDATRQASEDYADLEARHSDLQVKVTLIFVVVGLVLLTVAMWFGVILARQLVSPISNMITTVDRVRAGDLSARLTEGERIQEFDFLARAFNRMTRQLQEQQAELLEANRQLDHRRRFTETVLAGVSSGVLGMDAENVVTVANSSALKLLGLREKDLLNTKIEAVLPEVSVLLEQAHAKPKRAAQAEIPVYQKDGSKRIFLFSAGIELIDEKDMGAVLTFDDITELQSAQRKAAWADVARRIAHEIKNPLTPIQLSAERLKRKYLPHIQEDPETFSQCTDTIIRHVEDIGRMVNEFSSFARMPEPVFKSENLVRHVEEAIFIHKQAHSDIKFEFVIDESSKIIAHFDAQQIRQAINNLIQNAVDSVHATLREHSKPTGSIRVLLDLMDNGDAFVSVTDSGAGFPKVDNVLSLTEPYVTHKLKGTGLGLAIVKKIMEDHGGSIILGAPEWIQSFKNWKDLGGATVILILPQEKIETQNLNESITFKKTAKN